MPARGKRWRLSARVRVGAAAGSSEDNPAYKYATDVKSTTGLAQGIQVVPLAGETILAPAVGMLKLAYFSATDTRL